ncbi:PepSY domain-containing protein [Nocardioides sp. zg-1228]|uniref:PepSY domain-containing protein n=1 Tax=Nocardioides sp. zg-1228 TaxID=2763008 RepID=UPI001642F377|nr:PepSY domain-containing protein [Nocardioides sp. zg-1228]MBC2932983.1 PepSY domain-containing protein [Nocardioides sp. zg-1228]QSF56819.1 PepSY domain-containing protein [Nocardioides sp. zg-1228]
MNVRRTALAALALPLSIALVACGDDSADDASDDQSASSSPASPSDSSSSADTETDAPSDADAPVLAAVLTAVEAVPGGTLFSLDQEVDGWEAEVVDADAKAFDLTVSADGATVTRDPVEDTDAEDRAERERLLADVDLDPEEALAAARGAVTTGTITGLDLDVDKGTPVWDVKFDEDSAVEQTVVVDAATGDVLRTIKGD